MHRTDCMIDLAKCLVGRLQINDKQIQLDKVLTALNLGLLKHNLIMISNDNSWISGFFDAEGTVNCNQTSNQLSQPSSPAPWRGTRGTAEPFRKNEFLRKGSGDLREFSNGLFRTKKSAGSLVPRPGGRELGQLSISISQKDHTLLYKIKDALGVGYVYPDRNSDTYKYYVSSRIDLLLMLEYLDKFTSRVKPKARDLDSLKRLIEYKRLNYHKSSNPNYAKFIALARTLVNR